MYTNTIVGDRAHAFSVMSRMEEEFKAGKEDYFIEVIRNEPSLVLRLHAVTILANVGGEESVKALSEVLLNDPDPLVRHEAAFSLGQIGLSSGNRALEQAVVHDTDAIVRHESAAALGSIGSQDSKVVLQSALKDPDEIVRNSAEASLFNLEFLEKYSVGATAKERMPRP